MVFSVSMLDLPVALNHESKQAQKAINQFIWVFYKTCTRSYTNWCKLAFSIVVHTTDKIEVFGLTLLP